MAKKPPTVAVIGRTNVGKSTLFNRFAEQNKALVSKKAGTTRDRQETDCIWRGQVIRIIDTGGLDVDPDNLIDKATIEQSEKAIEKADMLLFVVDLKEGPLPQERKLAKRLKKMSKPIIVVGNKAESPEQFAAAESKEWKLSGLPSPFPVSALRGTSIGDLLDDIYDRLTAIKKPPIDIYETKAIRVAVIGKPNVGKSSLLNSILKEERYITSPFEHTTRQPNDTLLEIGDTSYVLIDTAGIRKMGKVKKARGIEAAGVSRTMRILKQADVALFVLDASQQLTTQDKALAGLIAESNVGVVFVSNKWDLVEDKKTNTMNDYIDYISLSIPFVRWAPVIFVSAKTKQRVKKIFPIIDRVQEARHKEISNEELEEFLKKALRKHNPSKGKGPKIPKIVALRQVGTIPPRFHLFIRGARVDVLHPSYIRYLENRLREEFKLEGTPVIIRRRSTKSKAK